METLKLTLLSPERKLLDHFTVQSVTVTGSEGQIEILPGHSAMIGTVETGLFSYQLPDKSVSVGVISSGFFEIKDDLVRIMAETVELKSEINLTRAQEAQKRAEKALQDAALDEHQFRKYQFKLQRALIRQQIAGKGEH